MDDTEETTPVNKSEDQLVKYISRKLASIRRSGSVESCKNHWSRRRTKKMEEWRWVEKEIGKSPWVVWCRFRSKFLG